MCFHRAEIKVEDGINTKKDGRINLYKNLEEREYTGAEILRQWTVPTASVVHRKEIKRIQRNVQRQPRHCKRQSNVMQK